MTTYTSAKATRCASPRAPRVASATNFLHMVRPALRSAGKERQHGQLHIHIRPRLGRSLGRPGP